MEERIRSIQIPSDATLPQRHPQAPAVGARISSHYKQCFGCGTEHETGLHMVVTAGQGVTTTAVFEVTAHHQGAPGIAHGGLLALAFDEALGATNQLIRASAVTAHLDVQYRAPVPVGAHVHISAQIDAVQRRKIWASAVGRLGSPEGPVVVDAASLFVQVPVSHFLKYGRAQDVAAASQDPDVLEHLATLDIAP